MWRRLLAFGMIVLRRRDDDVDSECCQAMARVFPAGGKFALPPVDRRRYSAKRSARPNGLYVCRAHEALEQYLSLLKLELRRTCIMGARDRSVEFPGIPILPEISPADPDSLRHTATVRMPPRCNLACISTPLSVFPGTFSRSVELLRRFQDWRQRLEALAGVGRGHTERGGAVEQYTETVAGADTGLMISSCDPVPDATLTISSVRRVGRACSCLSTAHG
jgi:hypothetical protein